MARHFGLRLTDEDQALLDALVAHEQAALTAQGLAVQMTAADVMRSLLRQAAEARGVTSSKAKSKPVRRRTAS